MTYRSRLILSFLLASMAPIIVVAFIVRSEMASRLRSDYEDRVDTSITLLREEIETMDRELRARLAALGRTIADDNRFRLAVSQPSEDRNYVVDYAESVLRVSGLSALLILDETGRIASSGHFRGEFDRLDAGLVDALLRQQLTDDPLPLVELRTAEGHVLVGARLDSVRIGDRRYMLLAGQSPVERFNASTALDPALEYRIEGTIGSNISGPAPAAESLEQTTTESAGILESAFALPLIDSDRTVREATVTVRYDLSELARLRSRLDRWILIVAALTGLLAIFLVAWNASRLSRPLVDLARRADRLDLNRLDVDFKSPRRDEIGTLSRAMGKMTQRMRAGAHALREAERRAAVGDLARQINHDIKNGITPIRNIVRHLAGLSETRDKELPDTFEERLPALESGISYLESLSTSYGRLSSSGEKALCNLDQIVRSVATDYTAGGRTAIQVTTGLVPPVSADPVALRRIIENLVSNAIDSLPDGRGKVSVATDSISSEEFDCIRLTVSDTGTGMSEETRSRIFENFYTTKSEGSGLGLSIVRRLVMDLGGSISVESEPGRGSRFTVDLPAAAPTD